MTASDHPAGQEPRTPCRLYLDGGATGAWNMALDEALLEASADGAGCSLRIYGWNEPTLSLGYFQSHADRQGHQASRACALVRRSSGGGAILHDRELTYSIAVPAGHRLARDAERLYRLIHHAVRETLQGEWGLEPWLHEAGDAEGPASEPFLCFQRRAAGDLLLGDNKVGGHKIGGSAQRRRKGAVLQHGSILFERSQAAPELAGISDLANIPGLISHFSEPWLARLSVALGLDFQPAVLTHAVVERGNVLVTEKYGNPAWIARK